MSGGVVEWVCIKEGKAVDHRCVADVLQIAEQLSTFGAQICLNRPLRVTHLKRKQTTHLGLGNTLVVTPTNICASSHKFHSWLKIIK